MNELTVVTNCADETVQLGELVGRLVRAGDFIALIGDLGSGKTQFVKGVAAGLDVASPTAVTSPTYTLLNVYSGRLPLYHFDLYRLAGDQDVVDLGFADYFYGSGVSLVEWADRLREEMPQEVLTVCFCHEDEYRRRIRFSAAGERCLRLLEELRDRRAFENTESPG